MQIFGFAQRGISGVMQGTRDWFRSIGGEGLPPDEAEALRREVSQLRRLVGHQHQWVTELERQLEEVTGLANQLADSDARILVAPVLGFDTSPRRETILIGRGSLRGVETGMWVAAAASPRKEDPTITGRQLLMRGWLVGRVVEVRPYTARVQLTTDPGFRQLVRTAKAMPDGVWVPAEEECVLYGRGSGTMLISEAEKDYLLTGYRVVLAERGEYLPVGLTLGQVVQSRQVESSPLHVDLVVHPWDAVTDLREVYVIITGSRE